MTKKAKKNHQKKKKGRSVQQLLGIKRFIKNGIRVGKDDLYFYAVNPTRSEERR